MLERTARSHQLTLAFRHPLGEILGAVVLFVLGPVLLCRRFPDWLWIGVIAIGFAVFAHGALGLIGGQNKRGVLTDWKKLMLFILACLAAVGLAFVLYIGVLVLLLPPI